MKLFDVITTVKKQIPDVSGEDICKIVNELEDKIHNEIFSPHGIKRPYEKLNIKDNINENLFLDDAYLSLYIYFIYAVLLVRDLDFESANAYSLLFNERFKELAAFYRKNNLPIKNTPLKGGF